MNTEKQVGASDSAEYVQAKTLICRGGHSLRKMNLIFTTVKLLVNVKPWHISTCNGINLVKTFFLKIPLGNSYQTLILNKAAIVKIITNSLCECVMKVNICQMDKIITMEFQYPWGKTAKHKG